jgi:hypothetical protein
LKKLNRSYLNLKTSHLTHLRMYKKMELIKQVPRKRVLRRNKRLLQ